MERKQINGIHYVITGEGRTLVLVHGFGEDGSIWENQIEYFKNDYRIIVPDLRGIGQSEIQPDEHLYIESMANDIMLVLEAEATDSCILFGHSMGGYITLAFAEMFPEKLAGFGLIHSTSYADSEEKKTARKKGIEFMQANGSITFLSATIPNLYGEKFKSSSPELLNQLLHKSIEIKKETLIVYYEAMMKRKDRTEVLRNSTCPVFIFIGDEDKAVSPEDALYQSTLPANCQVKLVRGIAHMGMWEAPDLLNEEIQLFLSTLIQ
jgi:pimeloyl-ACP methyl ester carboxylesterase